MNSSKFHDKSLDQKLVQPDSTNVSHSNEINEILKNDETPEHFDRYDKKRLEDSEILKLVQETKKRGLAGYEILIRKIERPLFRFLLSLSQNYADSQDLLQDTYVRIFRSLHTFDERYRFLTWALTIARNVFLSDLRKKKSEKKAVKEQENERKSGVANFPFGSAEARVDFETIISLLSEEEYEILQLRVMRDLSYDEISKMLGSPSATLRTKMFRCLKKIREAWKCENPE